jgi:hypothetical protein
MTELHTSELSDGEQRGCLHIDGEASLPDLLKR